jgi:hypothetical protein
LISHGDVNVRVTRLIRARDLVKLIIFLLLLVQTNAKQPLCNAG